MTSMASVRSFPAHLREQDRRSCAALFWPLSALTSFLRWARVVPELRRESVRELIFQNYGIVYLLSREGGVMILAIVHSAMDMRRRAEGEGWELM